jgi:ribosomal protein S18 acetylase RimI-like enzyme
MLGIRTMRREDIPFAVQVSDKERWGIPARDFRRILRFDPHGSFIATEGREKVGLATTISYGRNVAWIGNVVVSERFRGRHIGQLLVIHAVTYLTKKGLKHIALYCFDENIEFYRKLGFVEERPFGRLQRRSRSLPTGSPESISSRPSTLAQALSLDRKAFGADRSKLIRDWVNSKTGSVLGIVHRGTCAYILIRGYGDMCEIGPWVNIGAKKKELESMLRESLTRAGGRPIEVSVPLHNPRALRLFKSNGFRVVKMGTSMYFGAVPRIGRPEAILALGFLDKG